MRSLFRKILLWVNIFFAACLLVSYLAVHISPEDFILPAFFGLLYPYLLIVNIFIAAVWAVNLKWQALISVVVIFAGFNHMVNYIRPSKPSGTVTPDFTLMSYNVRLFNLYEGPGSTGTEKEILELIGNEMPDILCIQEYFSGGDWGRLNNRINQAIGGNGESHVKMTGMGRGSYYGIATFSRFPIISRGEIIHPNSSSFTIYSDIVVETDTFRVFNNHLQSFRLRRMERSFLGEITGNREKSMSEIRSMSVSLRDGFVKRASQATVLKAFIDSSPYPVIVTGDFNDTPVSYSYRKIRKGLTDSFLKSGYGTGFTYKGKYPPNRIDYILHDTRLKSVSFSIARVKFSDHYPVKAGFIITD
jgi:endonuclease/exonuclease/phosphatase family metal-dependent hydrolase